jgi:hypothetical protein
MRARQISQEYDADDRRREQPPGKPGTPFAHGHGAILRGEALARKIAGRHLSSDLRLVLVE